MDYVGTALGKVFKSYVWTIWDYHFYGLKMVKYSVMFNLTECVYACTYIYIYTYIQASIASVTHWFYSQI